MTRLGMRSCLLVLAGLALAACSAGPPSNDLILDTLNTNDELARIGCIEYSGLVRENGFPSEESYRVEFRVNKKLAMSTEDCAKAMTQSSTDPFKLLGNLGEMMGRMWDLAALEVNGGQETVRGEMYLVKSEKGWVARDLNWKK